MSTLSPPAPPPPDALAPARFGALFELAPFSIQRLAPDGRTLAVNPAWRSLWGATPDNGIEAYVLGEYNILADPLLEKRGLASFIARAFAGETVTTPRSLYDPAELGLPGRARWVVGHLTPVRDTQGIAEVLLVHEDVTDHVQSENALRSSEERLKQLANTIPQLAWMADPKGWIHWYNDRWYAYTGTTPKQMEGWGWQEVHDPAVLPQVLERWQASIATGEPFQMTFPLRGRDGRFRPFFTLVAPLKDATGTVMQWFGTNTDVSPLQEAEAELRRAEARLRIAVEAGGIGIWDWDVAQDRVTWSDRVYQLHGLAPGTFGGTAAAFAALVHPLDRPAMAARIETAVAQGTGFSAEFRALWPDGTSHWLSAWASAERDADGRASRIVGAVLSIDDFKNAEEALRQAAHRKDEFLAMLAHELRNPLAPISATGVLLERFANDPARVRQAAEVLQRQSRHMVSLLDDLLDVSRVTRGLIQLKPERLALDTVVDAAIEQVRPQVEGRAHQLHVALQRGLVLDGDSTRLVQVIVNLLTNACKYTPRGGSIRLDVEGSGSAAVLRVTDNGNGIEPELLPQIFELFTQGRRTPDRSQGGLGIGLALVRSIVRMHGGDVAAASQGNGLGSTFTVTLPLPADAVLPEAPAAPSAPAAAAAGDAGTALAVLLVDDNADAAETLATLLEYEGHQVAVAPNAATALRLAVDRPLDACILDIGLPDMDGHRLAQELRRCDAARGALFIALTGYGQSQDRERSSAAGFDHHFVKPVEPDALTQVLRQRLQARAPAAATPPAAPPAA